MYTYTLGVLYKLAPANLVRVYTPAKITTDAPLVVSMGERPPQLREPLQQN